MRLPKLQAVLGVFIILALGACKEPEGIGLEVLPDGEEMAIAWIDSFTVVAQTVEYDSVQTSGLNSGTYLIGDFGDPIFGRTKSEFYTEFLLAESSSDFGSGPVIDSIILNMAYSGSYGSTDKLNGNMRFGVFEVEEDLHPTATGDSTYYSNTEIDLAATAIAEFDIRPDLFSRLETYATNDTGTVDISPSMRVRLADEFGQRVLNSQNLASQEIFAEEFEGICVKPIGANMPDGNGSILYFNMVSQESRIEMYYHNADGDTLYVPFNIDNSHGAHTRFDHNFPTTITDAIGDSTVTGANRLYIQSMAGLRMKVQLPHVRELNNLGAVAINKAELVIPVDESVITEFGYPTDLQITGINEDGDAVFLIDLFEGSDYHGGSYDVENGEYVFNIARHIQSLLNAPEEADYGLYIVNSGNAVNARRGVFNGPEHADKPMKLRMTYTIIE